MNYLMLDHPLVLLTNTVRFGCNWILNDTRPIEATTVDVDDTTDDEITGFRTRFEKDLRPG